MSCRAPNSVQAVHYPKLWRILYTPKKVFDELREDQHTGLPVLITIGVVAIATFVIAMLTPTAKSRNFVEISMLSVPHLSNHRIA